MVLTVDKGVTFGFLKLLYNAELSNNCSILLGVKPRGELSQKIISSENSLLDKDEYDLLVSGRILLIIIYICFYFIRYILMIGFYQNLF